MDRSSDIAGPDANKNGVRDDIEAWIDTLSVTEPQRKGRHDAGGDRRFEAQRIADAHHQMAALERLRIPQRCRGCAGLEFHAQ